MHAMLTKEYRHAHHAACYAGYKCCDYDGREHKQVRRSARRTGKQAFLRAVRSGQYDY